MYAWTGLVLKRLLPCSVRFHDLRRNFWVKGGISLTRRLGEFCFPWRAMESNELNSVWGQQIVTLQACHPFTAVWSATKSFELFAIGNNWEHTFYASICNRWELFALSASWHLQCSHHTKMCRGKTLFSLPLPSTCFSPIARLQNIRRKGASV